MAQDDLGDLNPPPEVVALGPPAQVFRQPRGAARDALLSFCLFGLPSALLGLLLLALPLTVFLMKDADRAKVDPRALVLPPLFSIFFFLVARYLYVRVKSARRMPVYAIYPTALAIWQEGAWSLIAWDEVSDVLPHSLSRWHPALQFPDGRIQVLRYTSENPLPLSVAIEKAYREVRRAANAGYGAGAVSPVPVGAYWEAQEASNVASGGGTASAILESFLRRIRALDTPERRQTFRQVFGGLLLLVSLGLTVSSWQWLTNAFTGPVPLSRSQLVQLRDVADLPNPYVTIPADKVLVFDVIRTDGTGKREAKVGQVYLIQVGNRWLFTEMSLDSKAKTFTGLLTVWPTTPAQEQRRAEARKQIPSGTTDLFPFQMESATAYVSAVIAATLCFAGMFVAGWYLLLRGGA